MNEAHPGIARGLLLAWLGTAFAVVVADRLTKDAIEAAFQAGELTAQCEREGGVVGTIDVLPGGPGQGRNDYLMARLGSAIPAFRGVLSLVARPPLSAVPLPRVLSALPCSARAARTSPTTASVCMTKSP